MDKSIKEMKMMITQLNNYRDLYYNHNQSAITDYEYDTLFDKLKRLEEITGVVMSNSPTKTVGYKVSSKLDKVKHEFPLLSLDKTKSFSELEKFVNSGDCLLMHKLDGLTCCLTYDDGELVRAETRGDGVVGEDITQNAETFDGVPLTIPYKEHYVVAGEAIIQLRNFEWINSKLETKDKYRNPRNLVSGTVRQLDSSICAERHVIFKVWDILSGGSYNTLSENIKQASNYGFAVVTNEIVTKDDFQDGIIKEFKGYAEYLAIPIDGLVLKYDNIEYGNSLGRTEHHFKNGIAYKFYDEEVLTNLTDIEWSMGRSGVLTPIAIFNPIDIEGTRVSRASLHNVSIFNSLELGMNDEIAVCKANAIIPQISDNLTRSNTFTVPNICPVCGGATTVVTEQDSSVLVCTNDNCKGKLLGKLAHFVSKPCMNVDGLSEATLNVFIKKGWLENISDIYRLKYRISEIEHLSGFGVVSASKLLKSIEKSRAVPFEKFINALGIPLIGKSAARLLANTFTDIDKLRKTDVKALLLITGFGEAMAESVCRYFDDCRNSTILDKLLSEVNITYPIREKDKSGVLCGKIFCATGSVHLFQNRDELIKVIETYGGVFCSTVNNNTTYLINNDIESNSSKNKKAKKLGIDIITEEQFCEMIS